MAARIRLPLTTMALGAVAAWALLVLVGVYNPVVFEPRVLIAGGAIGAAAALIIELLLSWWTPASTLTVGGVIRRGCLFSIFGYGFFVAVALVVAISSDSTIKLQGCLPALTSLVGFGGLGIAASLAYVRLRQAEADRQRAALDAQAAAFARQELELARDLQQRLLPPPRLDTAAYRVVARNIPAAYVAGDFYDFVPLSGGRLLIVIADVAGKGVGAGLIMATVKAMIPLLAAEERGVASLMGRLNDRLADQVTKREFVASILGVYDPAQNSLTVSNAGLPDPLLIRADEIRPLVVGGPRYPLGIRKTLPYESVTTRLQPGDRILFFTDGLPEANIGGEMLGYERLITEVRNVRGDFDALFAALEGAGGAHDDDWTAVMLMLK